MHDALLWFGACLLAGLGEVERQAQEHFGFAWMLGGAPSLAIGIQIGPQFRKRTQSHRGKNRITLCTGRRKTVRAVDCDADFRALRSVWPRRHGDIIEAVVFTAVAQARFAHACLMMSRVSAKRSWLSKYGMP